MDHILLIDKVPIGEELYPKAWLANQVLEMCKKHHARVLNPLRDIHFEEDEFEETTGQEKEGVNPPKVIKKCYKIVVVLDGWNHMMPLPDYKDYYEQQEGGEFKGLSQIVSSDYRKFIELVDSDTEDEQEAQQNALAAQAERLEEERKQKEAEEQIKPVEWSCEICTYINSMSDSTCGMCGQGRRPSMEQLMAALRKQKQEESNQNQSAGEGSKEQDEGQVDQDSKQMIKHETTVRLKFLAFDIAKIIKVEQKRVAKKQEAENLEQLRKQKLKEKEEKACQSLKDKAVAENQGQDLAEAVATRPKEAEKALEVDQKEEEKKHQDSDAEKSDDDDDDGQWQDEESGGESRSSSDSDQKSHIDMAEVDAFEQVEAQEVKGAAELEVDQNEDDPRLKKLADLGYDLSILDADPQFAEALLASADLQEEQAREEERKRQEEEEALKKKQADEKLRAENLKELELLKKQGLAVKKVEYHSLRVYHGVEQIQENQNAVRVVFKFLSMRLVDLKTGELTDRSQQVLQEIHTALKEQDEDNICFPDQPFEEQLADYGLTKELIKEMELEEFEQTCSVLVAADVILLFRFLESQGYDYWLQKSAYPSFKPPIKQSSKFNCSLIEKLKEFVEINFCEEKKVIQHLEPYQLRLLSKMEGRSTVLPPPASDRAQIIEPVGGNATAQMALEQSPLGLYDDTIISMNASQQGKLHWFNQVTQADISYYWALIKTFSKYFAITVPFINCSTSIADNPDEGAIPMTLSAYMSSLRNLCLSNTKYELKHLILKKTSADREKAPVLLFERLKLHSDQGKEVKAKEPGDKAAAPSEISNSGAPAQIEKNQSKNFEFTQAYEQLKDIDYGVLRPSEPKGTDPHLSFEVYFKGEDVVGMGGPYRQFFSDVSQELQMVVPKSSSEEDGDDAENASTEGQQGQDPNGQSTHQKAYLDLLCPSRNMLRNSEKGKDNFVLNPLKVSAHELSLYNFLGVLMGVCIRTSTNLAIKLPSLVWKQLVGQRLTLDDIEEFDDGIITELKEILDTTEEDFESKFGDRYFTTTLSDLSTIELEEGGASRALTFQNRVEYARKTLYERMKECELQCEAIKRGICQIIPEALLNMVSFKELEEWIYGKKTIDVELLRRHTEYSKGYGIERKEIQWFWEILREMSQEDRRKFIRFCFAQSTIPPNDEEFERRQLRFLLRPVTADDKKKKDKDIPQHIKDQRLPKADTCFFNFELPAYSSKEVMKQKILFAISFDNVSLNAEQEDMQIPDNVSHKSHESRESY